MYEDVLSKVDGTLAAVAGTATTTAIAAPGADRRIRLVGGHVGCNRAAGVAIDALLTAGGSLYRFGAFNDVGTSSVALVIPPPGFVFPVNTAVTFQISSTAATGAGIFTLFYFIDDFS